jgi:hypothetical protein
MTLSEHGHIAWVVGAADARQLSAEGFRVEAFGDLRERFIEAARSPSRPVTLENPAEGLFRLFDENKKIAVTGVVASTLTACRTRRRSRLRRRPKSEKGRSKTSGGSLTLLSRGPRRG